MKAPDEAVVSVLEVGGTHVSAARVDVDTRAILPGQSVRLPLNSRAGAEEFVATLAACAELLPGGPGRRWSIAVPGPFDYESGIAHYEGVGKFDALRGFDLRTALAERLPGAEDVVFHNDADAFGAGEWWAGAARGRDRMVGITLGTGVGSCFLQDGRPVWDGPGLPPLGRINELNHAGKPFEETVSRQALRLAYAEAAGRPAAPADGDADVKEIAQRARDGEPAATEVFDRIYRVLGVVLAPILDAFAPQVLVIGGSISASWDMIEKPLLAGLCDTDPARGERIDLALARHPADAPLLGAAYLATEGRATESRAAGHPAIEPRSGGRA